METLKFHIKERETMKQHEITVITVFDNKQDSQQLFVELIINKRQMNAKQQHDVDSPSECHCEGSPDAKAS